MIEFILGFGFVYVVMLGLYYLILGGCSVIDWWRE
jgi:hypothetical protein